MYSPELYPVSFLSYVWFVVRKDSYFLLGFDIVHTEFDVISSSLSSGIHVHLMKDIPLSREKTSSKGLDAVFCPTLYSLDLWLTPFESSFVGGDKTLYYRTELKNLTFLRQYDVTRAQSGNHHHACAQSLLYIILHRCDICRIVHVCDKNAL